MEAGTAAAQTSGPETSHLRTEVVQDVEELEALRADWWRLVAASRHSTVFATPSWVLTWYRYFGRVGDVYAVLIRQGDELVGLAPFVRIRMGRPPAGFQLLVTAGTDHGYYGEPLLGPDPGPVAEALAAHLAELVAKGTAAVNLRRLWTGGVLHETLRRRDDVRCEPMAPPADSAVVRFDQLADPEDYLETVARRHSVPRRTRRLREAFDHVEYVAADPDVDAALDAMLDMLERRWQPGTGPATFAGPRRAAFARASIDALAADGCAAVSSLKVDGRHAAVSVAFRVADRVFSDHAAFDPDLARYGVGQRELYEALRHAHRSGATEVDLSAAADFPYKLRWANASYSSQSVALTAPGRRRRIAAPARRAAMSYRARRLTRLEGRSPER